MHSLRAALAAAVSCIPLVASASENSVANTKTYLIENVVKMDAAAAEFAQNAAAYRKLIEAAGGDYATALKNSRTEILRLISTMQENYKSMDSFGYESVEGIVAGVKSLSDFDIYLDSGVTKADASGSAPAAPVALKLASGNTIDGSLFTCIIEPALWGGNKHYVAALDVDGDGKISPKESLPLAEVLTAASIDVHKKISELLAASRAWQPTVDDCFSAIATMTPTFSGYFDDWKESRYAEKSSGKFAAVSRVSDMRGIMSSVAVLFKAVEPQVRGKDAALARSINRGFTDILSFIDRVEAREKKYTLSSAEIDEMGNQAKAKSDKLVPQVEQAAAVLNVKLQGA